MDLEKQKKCFEKLEEIMDKMYGEIKGTALFRRIMENIKEGSKKYILAKETGNENDIRQFNTCIDGLYELAIQANPEEIKSAANKLCVEEFSAAVPDFNINMGNVAEKLTQQLTISEHNRLVHTHFVQQKHCGEKIKPRVIYELESWCTHFPEYNEIKRCLEIPIQESVTIEPNGLGYLLLYRAITTWIYDPTVQTMA